MWSYDYIDSIAINEIGSGWEKLTISGCENLGNKRARNGFGYSYNEGSIYIYGGFSGNRFLNSIMWLNFDNSCTVVKCTTKFCLILILHHVAGLFYLFGVKKN